jgi:hypothetical protein
VAADAVILCDAAALIVVSKLSILLFIVLILGTLGPKAAPCFMLLTFIILVRVIFKLERLEIKSPITSDPL